MSTRREFLKQTAAASALVSTGVAGSASRRDENTEAKAATKINKAAHQPMSRIKSVIRREQTVLRYGGNGDNWHMSWAADDRQYLSLCDGAGFDGAGFSGEPKTYYNSRMLAISGGPRDAKFDDVPGFPVLAEPARGRKEPRYYSFGTLALDGYLYQYMSTFNRAARPEELHKPDLNTLWRFNGVKLIYSPDNGRTWRNQDGSTPVVWEDWNQRSRETMVFFDEDQEAFSLLSVLQMGKNYEHNRDGYVYVYAPNGNSEGTMNELVMFRVPKGQIINRAAYEYFGGLRSDGNANWSKNINARAVVHTFPRGWVNTLAHPYAWHPSVVYNAPLELYMMANWGMGTGRDGTWFSKPSYLGFWIAQNPWGPWTQIHEETAWMPGNDPNARAYQPQIAPKWIAADGKSFWLVWTDFQGFDSEELKLWWKEYRRKAFDPKSNSEEVVMRNVSMMQRYLPHYAFNVQRVSLVFA